MEYFDDQGRHFVRAAADGSSTVPLQSSQEVLGKSPHEDLGELKMWGPEDTRLLGMQFPGMVDSLPPRVILLGSNPSLGQCRSRRQGTAVSPVISLDTIIEGQVFLVGWDMPGKSVWVRTEDNRLVSVPLT